MADILIETKEIVYAFATTKDGETAYFFKKKPKKIDLKQYEQLRKWLASISILAKNKNLDEINQDDFWSQWNIFDGYAIHKKEKNKKFKIPRTSWKMLYSS